MRLLAAAALLSATADGVAAVLAARGAERAAAANTRVAPRAEDLSRRNSRGDASGSDESGSDSDESGSDSDAIDARAADAAAASVAEYLAGALRGVALDAGPCGEAEPTAEGDYGELLRAARLPAHAGVDEGEEDRVHRGPRGVAVHAAEREFR